MDLQRENIRNINSGVNSVFSNIICRINLGVQIVICSINLGVQMCVLCSAALLPFFNVSNLEFQELNCSKVVFEDVIYGEYVSLCCELLKLTSNLITNDLFFFALPTSEHYLM